MNASRHNSENCGVGKLKILYLSLNPNLDGPLPKIDPLLISALNNLGCQITKGTWGRHNENENMFQKIFGRVGDIGKALMALTRGHYDILYVATTLDEKALFRDVPLLLAASLFPVKKILIEHGSKTAPLALPGNNLYKFLTRLVIRLSDAILLLSNEERKSWIDFEPRGRYYRVDNPFCLMNNQNPNPLARPVGNISERPNLLFVGRLIKAKGIFDLLDAMPIILRQVDCHLLIAGGGEEKEEINRRIDRAKLTQSVSLVGYLDADHLADIYKSSSVFILPTYFGEGFPTVIAEAMSFGVPIVTTPLRGVYDHLKDGENALFVQPRNPDAIAKAVLRLLNNPGLCVEMGQANLVKVREFSPENVAPNYFEIFSKTLSSN